MKPDNNHVSINGRIVPLDQAGIPLENEANFHGYGVYEAIEIRQWTPFHLEDHVARLFQSTSLIGINMPGTEKEVVGWALALLEHDSVERSLLRMTVLGDAEEGDQTLVNIWPTPLPYYGPECYTQGVQVIAFAGTRPIPRCKSLNTLISFLASRKASRQGAYEAILVDRGGMTEGARSNAFAVRDGVVLTADGVCALPGITKDLVLKLAAEAGIEVREQQGLPLEELPGWQEFFISSTTRHIMPVVRIDDLTVGEGRVGPVAKELMARFEAYHAGYLNRHAPAWRG